MNAEKQKKELSSSIIQPKQGYGRLSFMDNRNETRIQAKLIDNIHKHPIQMYTLGTGTTRTVNVRGRNDSCSFEECLYNYVDYQVGDYRRDGTGTSNPAAWANWLVNRGRTRNATQLHVVNNRWGGLGGRTDKNIVPGSPSENSHHYHQAEVFFDNFCFGDSTGQTALHDCKYECWASPAYGTSIDVSNGSIDFNDPTIIVKVTDSVTGFKNDYSPLTGTGLTVKDGS